jgi:hypothetical protein
MVKFAVKFLGETAVAGLIKAISVVGVSISRVSEPCLQNDEFLIRLVPTPGNTRGVNVSIKPQNLTPGLGLTVSM